MNVKAKRAFAKSGKTVQQVSKETGIPYTTIFDWVNGKTKDMAFKRLKKVSKALGTSVEELVSDD